VLIEQRAQRFERITDLSKISTHAGNRIRVSIAGKLLQRIEQENWRSTTIESDDYRLELHDVHALIEVGFVLWRKQPDGQLALVTSGHTLHGKIVGSEEEPLPLAGETHEVIEDLLSR
jgi:hypothetical protein